MHCKDFDLLIDRMKKRYNGQPFNLKLLSEEEAKNVLQEEAHIMHLIQENILCRKRKLLKLSSLDALSSNQILLAKFLEGV